MRCLSPWPALLAVIVLASGCATYHQKSAGLRKSWEEGRWQDAALLGSVLEEENADGKDAILFGLEQGAVLRATGDYVGSQEVFERTYERIQAQQTEADVRISQESASLFLNPGETEYRARTYDRIMLHTYEALNAIALGDPPRARVALNRALQAQRDAVAANARRLEEEQEELRAAREETGTDSVQLDQTLASPQARNELDRIYAPVRDLRPYAPYVNPFTVFLDGVFFLRQATDASDLERARKSLERVTGLVPESPWLRRELARAERRIAGEALAPSVLVLLETGEPPRREAERLDLPLFVFGVQEVPYVGIAFPVLRFSPNNPGPLTIRAGNQSARTETIANLDRIIGTEFEDRQPLVVRKAILSAASKALVTYLAREQFKDGSTAQALVDLAGILYQASTNQPDLRSWSTLPREIQGMRVDRPESGQLTLSLDGWSEAIAISAPPGMLTIVHVRVVNRRTPPVVHQYALP